jgi:glycosyltransferase involved in cell wall biosynthesis
MRSVSERIDEFHVAYRYGKPEREWKEDFFFHKVETWPKFVKSTTVRSILSPLKQYRQIKNVDVDVIYTLSGFWPQEFSRYCSSRMSVPYVVRLRGDHRETRKQVVANALKRRLLNYLETKSLKKADMVIPISMDLAEKAKRWGVEEDRIMAPVPIGVDTLVFRPMSVVRDERFTVAYAGRVSPEKRVPYLLKVAEELADVRFVIAGPLQMDVSFPDNVKYLGRVRFSEMPEFYNRADLIVLPSVTEGFPCVILEAYACGKPVLAAKEAFPKELEVFGSVVDISEFETEIKRLKSLDLKTVGEKARRYVEKHYTWEKFGRTIVRYLEDVIG